MLAVRSPEKPHIPEVRLEVSPSTVGRNVRTIHIGAEVTHQDGIEALTSVQLTVSDLFGRVTEEWSITDFAQAGSTTLGLQTAHRIRSKGPWRVRLRATDRNGVVSTIERQVDSSQ